MKQSKRSFAALVSDAVARKQSPTPKQKEILVPIDFSEPSLDALRHARELATAEKALVILLNVVEEPRSFRTLDWAGQQRVGHQQRAERLRELAERELGSQIAARTEVRAGSPSVEIARLASQRQVDLIVLGRPRHCGLWRWAHGHTASRLSKSAPCPVLLLAAAQLN